MTDPKQTASDYASKNVDTTSIYSTAKTSEERLQDKQDHELMILGRQPQHLALSAAIRLFIIVALGMLLFKVMPAIVAWNVLSGAFNVVLGALILFGIAAWQVGEIRTAMNKKGVNDATFFGIYAVVFATPMMIAFHAINQQTGLLVVVLYAGLFLIHYVLIRFLMQSMLDRH